MNKVKAYIHTLIVEGSRIGWTAVEAAGGFLTGYNVPLPDLGAYNGPVRGAITIAVAALATTLKEAARQHLTRTL